MELLQNFYETTLDALRDAKNERLWFKTMTKLGKLYFDRLDCACNVKKWDIFHSQSQGGVQQACQNPEAAAPKLSNGGGGGWSQEGHSAVGGIWNTLVIYTSLLGLTLTGRCMPSRSKCTQHRRTTRSWRLCMIRAFTSSPPFLIPLSLVSSGSNRSLFDRKSSKLICRECGGKMHLREGEFEKAHTDFFEVETSVSHLWKSFLTFPSQAFKNYDESGSPRRTTCLKYLGEFSLSGTLQIVNRI